MRKRLFMAFLALAAAIALSFASCDNGAGERGVFSLNVGRAVTGTLNGVDGSTFYHTVWLYDSAGEKTMLDSKQNETPTFSVDPGTYLFYVEAYAGATRPKGEVKAVGFKTQEITSGDNGLIEIIMEAPPAFPAITITGDPWEGEILMVNHASFPTTGTLSYEWTRDNAPIAGATGPTYELAAADAGHTIKAEVSHSGYSGIGTATAKIYENDITVTNDSEWAAAVTAIGSRTSGTYNITVTGSVTASGSAPGSTFPVVVNGSGSGNTFGDASGITVNLSGSGSITLSGQGSLLLIGDGQTVTSSGLTLNGHSGNNVSLVNISGGGTFTMNSGTMISGNTSSGANNGGGAINGGGVHIASGGTFNMDGGEISGNTATGTTGPGGGVYINGGTFNMTDGSVSNNTATSGGGVGIANNGTFNMSGGEVSGNEANGRGGGVQIASGGTFNMTGGELSGNKFTGSVNGDGGGGVHVISGGTFRIENGIIYGSDEGSLSNTAITQSTGAALNNSGTAQYGTFTTSGNPSSWSSKGPLATTNDTIVVVDGLFSNGVIDVATPSDWSTLVITKINNGGDGKTYIINVTGTISINGTAGTPIPNTFDASGVTVHLRGTGTDTISINGNDGSLLRIGSGQTVTMSGGLTLQGRSNNNAPLVYINSGGEFIMNGGKVMGNTATDGTGGGVYVSGTFTMNDGEVSGNTANSGGGVYVAGNNGGTFNMNGGKVSGNTAANNGGGVNVYSGSGSSIGTFTMTGGELSGNKVTVTGTGFGGGGVYVSPNNSTFRIVSGTIYGSTVPSDPTLANTAAAGAALLLATGGIAEYGDGTTWTDTSNLNNTDNTITVANGVM